jgi:uncharacterized membrane protein YqjE
MGVVLMSLALGIGYMFWRLDGNLVNYSKIFAVVGVWFGYSLILALRVAGKLVGARYAWACALLYLAALFSLWPVNQSRHPVVPETQAELRQKP